MAPLLSMLFSGCTDELKLNTSNERIRFVPKVDSGWGAMSRSGNKLPKCEKYTVEQVGENPANPSEPLYLHTKVEEGFVTSDPKVVTESELRSRATHMVTGPDNFYNEFRASASVFNSYWNEKGDNPNYFSDQPVVRNTNGSFDLTSKIFWPGQKDMKLRFTAYAPYKAGVTYGVPAEFSAVAYVTPSYWDVNLDNQTDLLIAASPEEGVLCTDRPEVSLNFRHALAAIRLEVGKGMDGALIKSIWFNDIWFNGVINMVTGEMDIPWGAGALRVNVNKQITDANLTDLFDGRVLLLPPNPPSMECYVTLNIDMVVNGVEKTETIPFYDRRWEGGKTYTYRISNKNYVEVMDVAYEGLLFSNGDEIDVHTIYSGGSDVVSLISRIDGVTPEPLPWKALFKPDGATAWSETPPSWLSLGANTGLGSVTGEEVKATTTAIVPKEVNLDQSLTKRSHGSPADPYNLTTPKTDEALGTTANCYIANGYGTYMLPLVYGNAWDADKGINELAYKGPSGTTHDDPAVLSGFVDHLGKDISTAFIKAQGQSYGFTVARAALLWEDSPGLITNVAYKPDLYPYPGNPSQKIGGITFDIPAATVRQGNAVIALYDTMNRVVWSWHIWVTPLGAQYTVPYISAQKKRFDIDAVNLGWVSFEPIKDYVKRTCRVKFQSETGNTSVEIIVAQQPHAVLCPGDAMVYQWGRKDPFRGCDRTGAEVALTVQRYKEGLTAETRSPRRDLIAWRTQHPEIFHRIAFGALTESDRASFDALVTLTEDTYVNMWDSKNTGQTSHAEGTSIKTVYDPCPPGFKVAPPDAFTGFIPAGGDAFDPSTWNGFWDASQKAFSAQSNATHLLQTLYPTLGYRDYDNLAATYYRGQHAYIWTSGAWNHSGAIYFWIKMEAPTYPGAQAMLFYNRFIHGNGYNVRAVREDPPPAASDPTAPAGPGAY